MPDPTQLLYLEPDDEITSVVRRLREADAGRVVLVASGRSKATASAVALRLLAGVAAEEGREIALVAEPAGRALAAEAGIPTFASVAEASAEDAVPLEPSAARRAPIRVVRGEEARVVAVPTPPLIAPRAPAPQVGPGDETLAIPAAPAAAPAPRTASRPLWTRGRPLPRAVAGALVAVLLLSVGALAAVAPAASIEIQPLGVAIEPVSYTLALPAADVEEGEVTAEVEGAATGVFRDPSRASGTVTFSNWNTVSVEVPQGTQVSAGEVIFETVERIVVPFGFFMPFAPGEESVGVVAVEAGPAGNVAADAIDFVVSEGVRGYLRGLPDNPNRLVRNPEATGGGAENRQPEITQEDVDAAVTAITQELAAEMEAALDEEPNLVYAPIESGEPRIELPDDLVGRRGEETFPLAGSQAYTRAHVELTEVERAARERLLADADAVPAGRSVVESSIGVEVTRVAVAGDRIEVQVTLTADAAPVIDADALRELVAGRTEPEAEQQLAWLGEVDVELWPGWVDRVPELWWRIDLRVSDADVPSSSPSASGSAAR